MANPSVPPSQFYSPTNKMTVTKLEAARRQLASALQLSFANGDPVAIHLLAYTSHDLIHRLFRRRGLKNDLLFDSQLIKPEFQSDWAKSLKTASNFFKHANRGDENETLEFNPAVADLFMLMSIYALRRMGFGPIPTESAFQLWFDLHFPSAVSTKRMAAEGIPIDRMPELTTVSRSEFFKAFLAIMKERNQL